MAQQEADTKHVSEMNHLMQQISKLESEKEKLNNSHTSLCMELHDVTEKKKSLEENIALLLTQVCMYIYTCMHWLS